VRRTFISFSAALLLFLQTVQAAEVNPSDIQVVAQALDYAEGLEGGDVTLGIVYSAADREAAEALAGHMRNGVRSGKIVLHPELIEVSELARHGGVKAIFLMPGLEAHCDEIANITRARHLISFADDEGYLRRDCCILVVRSQPTVDIILNVRGAEAAGVRFATVFILVVRRQ